MTSKPEGVIRDRLAVKLHQLLDKKTFTVAREWGKKRGRPIDLAILKGNRPEVLIQLKARSAIALQGPKKLLERAEDDLKKCTKHKGKKCFYLLVAPLIETPWDPKQPHIEEVVKYANKWKPALQRTDGASNIERKANTKIQKAFIKDGWRVDGSNNGKRILGGEVLSAKVSVLYWLCERR